jgi:hypothetical protein
LRSGKTSRHFFKVAIRNAAIDAIAIAQGLQWPWDADFMRRSPGYISLYRLTKGVSMHIFKEGRSPFLEFLRNLTPQAVLLSFALVAGYELQPTCCYSENAKQTSIFFVFLAIWLVAVWANSSLFIEKYLVSVKRIDRASKLLFRFRVTGLRNLGALLNYAWRKQRMVFVEAVVVFVVLEFGLAAVGASAISSATALLKLMHG